MIVNGFYMSHVDLTFNFDGLQISGISSLNYKGSLIRKAVRGTSPIQLGTTTGYYPAPGDMELYLPSAGLITTPGWMQVPHVATCIYGPNVVAPLPLVTDVIAGIMLTEIDASSSDNEDGLTRKFAFGQILIPILRNGVPDLVWPATIPAVG